MTAKGLNAMTFQARNLERAAVVVGWLLNRVVRNSGNYLHACLCVAVVLYLSWVPVAAQAVEIQKGAHLKVHLSSAISTQTAKKGEEFDAALAEDFVLEERVLIPRGSTLRGSVVRVSRPGRLRGRAELALHFHRIELPSGEAFDISASPVAAEGKMLDPSGEAVARGPS